ncbi:molybdate ABC transporter substrate-binding protein [Streptomyces sp. AC495_CC817]|uniref:molybdate ABC transporter substrate-binding protein n=1 Tax=Streptomyces sp. AC495_CC817 TaxID=2823900 RepID=UPI001C2629DE|nr:molybdate ABC transporter substrate-binding protein [Streptomyces sp. AC495_CC817]
MTRSIRIPALLAATALGLAALAGCSGSAPSPSDSPEASASASDELGGELTIFAAASLTAAFDELAAAFEAQHPDVDVLPISYDGSSVLATQLIEGAEADVFASADEKNLAKVTDAGLADAGEPFATNVLQIAVAPGDPKGVKTLADLADPGLTVVVCAAEVPCGSASRTLLDAAGVTLTPASEEQNVTAVLSKVKSGEADAGLVYATDVEAASDAVTGIEIDGADAATNVYPIAELSASKNPDTAHAFLVFVLSDAGQKVLASHGFGAP